MSPAHVRERRQHSSVTQQDGAYPMLPNQYKAYSMVNLNIPDIDDARGNKNIF